MSQKSAFYKWSYNIIKYIVFILFWSIVMLDFSDKKAKKKKPDCNINICVPFFIEKFWFEKLVNSCCSDKLPRRTNLRNFNNFRRMKGRKQWNKTRISRRNNNNYIYYAVYSYLGSELSRRNKCFFHFFPPPPLFFIFPFFTQ